MDVSGANPTLVHLNDLIANPAQLSTYDAMMFIGGFSYGDYMSSGHVFAQRIRHHPRDHLTQYRHGKLILGSAMA